MDKKKHCLGPFWLPNKNTIATQSSNISQAFKSKLKERNKATREALNGVFGGSQKHIELMRQRLGGARVKIVNRTRAPLQFFLIQYITCRYNYLLISIRIFFNCEYKMCSTGRSLTKKYPVPSPNVGKRRLARVRARNFLTGDS